MRLRHRPRKIKTLVKAIKRLIGGRRRVHRRRVHRRVHRRRVHRVGRGKHRVHRHRRHYRRGRGIFDSINNFLKKTKVISTIGKHLAPFAPYGLSGIANAAADYADKQGYGRRRRHHKRHYRGGSNPYPYNISGGSRLIF